MAEVEEALVTRLQAHTGLAALVSTRIYPLQRPQDGVLPCVTYQRQTSEYIECLGGTTDLAYPTIEFRAWGSTYASAKAVARQVFEALERWSSNSSTPPVQDVLPLGSSEDFDGDDVYWVSQEFQVWYTEA